VTAQNSIPIPDDSTQISTTAACNNQYLQNEFTFPGHYGESIDTLPLQSI
jgi:hypothetical protein